MFFAYTFAEKTVSPKNHSPENIGAIHGVMQDGGACFKFDGTFEPIEDRTNFNQLYKKHLGGANNVDILDACILRVYTTEDGSVGGANNGTRRQYLMGSAVLDLNALQRDVMCKKGGSVMINCIHNDPNAASVVATLKSPTDHLDQHCDIKSKSILHATKMVSYIVRTQNDLLNAYCGLDHSKGALSFVDGVAKDFCSLSTYLQLGNGAHLVPDRIFVPCDEQVLFLPSTMHRSSCFIL